MMQIQAEAFSTTSEARFPNRETEELLPLRRSKMKNSVTRNWRKQQHKTT
jgi:hypothetical protein